MKYDLDIIIPVLEKKVISKKQFKILKILKINFRIMIIYDFDTDPTIQVVKDNFNRNEIVCLKNEYNGFNGAIKTGFQNIQSNAAILYPADDHQNFNLILKMFDKYKEGYDIVCASRFVDGGSYQGAPFLKRLIVKFVSLHCLILLHYLPRMLLMDLDYFPNLL